jgi:hypothetical protein
MTVDVTTTQNPVTVSVNDTNVSVSVTDNVTTATVSGGTGPQGPTGPQGSAASLTPATTTTIGGIIVGTGLSVTGNGTLSATGAVSSVAGRTGAVTLTTADVSGYTAPPVTSVAGRTGTVTLTTADVSGYVAPQVFSVAGRTGTVTLTTSDISGYTVPPVSSVAGKTGTVTLTASDISGFNAAASAAAPVQSVAGRTGAVTLTTADVSGYTAPTVSSVAGRTGTVTLSTSDISGLGTLATQSGTFSGTSSGTNTGDQTISLTGDVTGSGTGSFSATLANSGATAGTYTSVTVDAKGRVTAGTNPAGYSLPNATTSILGGITVSTGLSVTSGAVSVAYGTSSTTACVGNDSRLSDSRTPTSHVHGNITNDGAIGSTSGQIVVTTTSGVLTTASSIASSAVTGLATVATSGSASDLSTGTLPDARISSTFATAANVHATLQAGAGVDTTTRLVVHSNQSLTSGVVFYTFFTPSRSMSVSQISMMSRAAGSGLTLARMALVSFDETTATILARTASDTTLFTTADTLYTRSFATAGGYPASYSLAAGTRYGIAVICVGTTMPGLMGITQNQAVSTSISPKLNVYVNSQSDIPTPQSSFTNFNTPHWARIS